MSRKTRAGLRFSCLLLTLSCSGLSRSDAGSDAGDEGHAQQATYSYPGCEPREDGCPRLLTLYCALEAITAAHATCLKDSDCEVVDGFDGRCSGYPRCPGPVVNVTQRTAFDSAFQRELDRYCPTDGSGCRASEGGCSQPLSAFRASCVSGACRAVRADGGM